MKGFAGFLFILVSRWALECSWRLTARGVFYRNVETAYIGFTCQGSMSNASEGFPSGTLIIPKGLKYSWNVCIADEDRT